MPEEPDPPQPTPADPTVFGGVSPDEMIARAMQTARLSGGAGAWEPPNIEEAAHLFPGYAVLKLIGRGGMGAVYQARQIELDRLVAIKLLPLEISVDRFRRGAHASRVLAKSSRLRALPHAPNAGSARPHSTRLGKFVVSGRHDQHAGRVRSPENRERALIETNPHPASAPRRRAFCKRGAWRRGLAGCV